MLAYSNDMPSEPTKNPNVIGETQLTYIKSQLKASAIFSAKKGLDIRYGYVIF